MKTDNSNIALVTGANQGIGHAIALRLGQDGMTVIGTAITEEGVASFNQDLAAANIKGQGILLDVRDDKQITAVIAEIQENYGTVATLINNAGITKDNLLMRMKDDEWHDLIDINLNSVYRMSKACLRGMLKMRYGRIISITSVIGVMGNPGQTNYAAAKAGVMGFSKSLARETGARGITVNTVAPGFIETAMTRKLPEEHKEELKKHITLGRLGQPEDVAAAVAFLASKDAAYITGHTIHVNGGMYM